MGGATAESAKEWSIRAAWAARKPSSPLRSTTLEVIDGSRSRVRGRATRGGTNMADVGFIALTVAFFALSIAYVRGLDRIVRATERDESSTEEARR